MSLRMSRLCCVQAAWRMCTPNLLSACVKRDANDAQQLMFWYQRPYQSRLPCMLLKNC